MGTKNLPGRESKTPKKIAAAGAAKPKLPSGMPARGNISTGNMPAQHVTSSRVTRASAKQRSGSNK